MAIPSLAMIPSGYKDGKVYSVLPSNGDGDFTFSRGSNATRVNKDGLIETMPLEVSDTELVTNGGFDTDSDWIKQSNWTISGGVASSDGSSGYIKQNGVVTNGKSYQISFNTTVSSGNFRAVTTADGSTYTPYISTSGSYVFYMSPSSNLSGGLEFVSNSFTGSIDNISIKEVLSGLDTPRLDYSDSSCPSLLLEPQSTNSFPNSEDYTVFSPASSGTGTNPVITSNYSVSPDGTQNADRIQFNRGSGTSSSDTSYIGKSLSLGTIDATLSIYLKTNDGTTKDVTLRLGASLFDYDVIVTSDWQRFTLSGNTSVDRLQILLYGNQNSESADLSCFGTQIEALSYPTSYIPTNGATATRLADVCTDAGTSDTFNDSEGVLMVEISALADEGGIRAISLNNGSTQNRISIRYNSTSNQIQYQYTVGSSVQANILANVVDVKTPHKIAVKYKLNDFELFIDGISRGTDLVGSIMPSGTLTNLDFNGSGSLDYFYGNVKQIQYFNTALTDEELQALTS